MTSQKLGGTGFVAVRGPAGAAEKGETAGYSAINLLESGDIGRIARATARRATYSAEIITNGYLLSQRVVDMLAVARVVRAQVTLDGLGPFHDATRHLAGGGPTFGRIVGNLRDCRIPFVVNVRHNVHVGS